MKKFSFIVIFLLFIPTAFSITLQDLINFFNFNFFTNAINVTNQKDFMIGKNSNGIDDTLIIELTTNGNAGNYFFIIDLYDNNNIITNETSKTITGLTNGNTYYYKIFTFDEVPNYSLGVEDSVIPADTTAPSNVSGFTASAGDSKVSLTWVNPTDSDFAGVKLLCKTGDYPASYDDTTATLIYTGMAESYEDVELTNETTYYYKI